MWLHHLQSKKFIQAMYSYIDVQFLGETPSLGFRLDFKFFCVDYYVSESEPVIEACMKPRIIVWDRESKDMSKIGKWLNILTLS
jgi:hypothetical protein